MESLSLTPSTTPINPAATTDNDSRSGRATSVARWFFDKVRGEPSQSALVRHQSEGARPLAPKANQVAPQRRQLSGGYGGNATSDSSHPENQNFLGSLVSREQQRTQFATTEGALVQQQAVVQSHRGRGSVEDMRRIAENLPIPTGPLTPMSNPSMQPAFRPI